MTRAVVAGVLLATSGLGLWAWALAWGSDDAARLSDLGSALTGGAVVAFAVFFLEHRAAAESERQSLRLLVGTQQDLRGADLSQCDLSGLSFSGKDLSRAVFLRSTLRASSFIDASVVDATFIQADLTGAVFSLADLKNATFAAADLSGAIFTEAKDLATADFATAMYRKGERPRFPEGFAPAGLKELP